MLATSIFLMNLSLSIGLPVTNPVLLKQAKVLDEKRRHCRVRGPLHGIPVLVKLCLIPPDHNVLLILLFKITSPHIRISEMDTKVGSLALVGSKPYKNVDIVNRVHGPIASSSAD